MFKSILTYVFGSWRFFWVAPRLASSEDMEDRFLDPDFVVFKKYFY